MTAQIGALPHPGEAVSLLERLLERLAGDQVALAAMHEPATQRALVRLAYAAPFLIRYLAANPRHLQAGVLSGLDAPAALLPIAHHATPEAIPDLQPEALQRALRRWKYANYLRLTAQHLLGTIQTPQICAQISRLAEGMIRVAYAYGFTRQAREKGLPVCIRGGVGSEGGSGSGGGLAAGAVIGMGKLGGGELNYSSDVDLIFIHDGEDAPCRPIPHHSGFPVDPDEPPEEYWSRWARLADSDLPPAAEGAITAGEFHNRLARQVCSTLSAKTADGFGFRVDLDLRPMGSSGLISSSLAFLSQYYDVHGREWERTALIKARPIAGSPRVAAAFQACVRPFVYRRYLDYGAIEGITLVKRDIDRYHGRAIGGSAKLGSARLGNIKLGKGGIRENEFFVQALQLLYGGKHPEIQVTAQAEAVGRLISEEIIPPDLGQTLLADYWILRRIENRLQMVNEAQTQELPPDDAGKLRVFCDFQPGFEGRLAEAEATLQAARTRTSERFAGLLSEPAPAAGSGPDAWRKMVKTHVGQESREAVIARIEAILSGLMNTRIGERCLPKAERLLSREELYRCGTDPALAGWLEFLERIGNRNTLFALLEAHSPILQRVSLLFAEGGRLASLLIRHPEFLESFVAGIGEGAMLESQQPEGSGEMFILELQGAKSRAILRILTDYLESDADQPADEHTDQHREPLSRLAEETVQACLNFAWINTTARLGYPAGARDDNRAHGFAVLAMGKLGCREMRFGSDLDLVFCYREDGTTAQGASHFQFYTKLAQSLSNLLMVPTQFGRLYDLDHRLRPFGSKGMLVPTLDAYRDFLSGAEVWNFQALTRMRFLAGDAGLAGDLIDSVARCWREKSMLRRELARAVQTMLLRLVRENGPVKARPGEVLPLKYAVGGLIGFEFLQQYHFLEHHSRSGGAWAPVEDSAQLAGLRAGYDSIGALDERLSLHVHPYRHEASPEQFQNLDAIGKRWRFKDMRDCLAAQETAIETAFWSAAQ